MATTRAVVSAHNLHDTLKFFRPVPSMVAALALISEYNLVMGVGVVVDASVVLM